MLLTEALIEESNWTDARNQIKLLLEHKPLKQVCLLMAKIEEGDSGDPQKIDAWISRSNTGKLSKIWICQVSGLTQDNWTSISQSGYFNSLVWQNPNNISQFTEFSTSRLVRLGFPVRNSEKRRLEIISTNHISNIPGAFIEVKIKLLKNSKK